VDGAGDSAASVMGRLAGAGDCIANDVGLGIGVAVDAGEGLRTTLR